MLRPGGRFAVSDVVADEDMDEATRRDMEQWTGCIAGALTASRLRARAGARPASRRSRSQETHRVHEHAASAIIRARVPTRDQAEIQLNDPQTLYRRWEDSQWSPFEIDLERDKEQWGQLSEEDRTSSTGCCAR